MLFFNNTGCRHIAKYKMTISVSIIDLGENIFRLDNKALVAVPDKAASIAVDIPNVPVEQATVMSKA